MIDFKKGWDNFRQLPPNTQLGFILLSILLLLILVYQPNAGTNIVNFLLAIKMLSRK